MPPAPIIVTAIFESEDQAWFDAQRRAYFPPERNHLSAHLTLFHHLPPSASSEIATRLKEETRGAAPSATLAGVISLGRGTAYRIESEALLLVRARLAEAFAGLLTPQDQAGWRPHVTVQNKVSAEEAKALRTRLEGFAPRSVRIAALAAWWYRGGPWDPLSRYPFRGR